MAKHGKAGKYRKINAAAFCQHYKIKTSTTLLFDGVDLDTDGVLMLDLNRTLRISRGAR